MDNIDNRIEDLFRKIAKIGYDGRENSFNRPAFSDEETRAMEVIGDDAKKLGFPTVYDKIGNFYVSLNKNLGGKYILIGSHLDTVPNGGNYDGVAGILAGLEALRLLNCTIEKNVRLVVWRGEESSRFKQAYLGSSAAFAQLEPSMLQRKDKNGITLEEAIKSCGFDPSILKNKQRTLSPQEIISYYELHIEQARVLETEQKDISIVTSIRGYERHTVHIKGSYDHSGGTPMNNRSDAVLAYSRIVSKLDKKAREYMKKGKDITFTAQPPRYNENEVSINKICGYVEFDIDVRSTSDEVLKEFLGDTGKIVNTVSCECKVTINLEYLSSAEPIHALDANLQKNLEEGCKTLSLKYMFMPSGAGHDAAVIAKQKIPTGLIFIPCKNGISHTSEEYTELKYIANGAKLLATTISGK